MRLGPMVPDDHAWANRKLGVVSPSPTSLGHRLRRRDELPSRRLLISRRGNPAGTSATMILPVLYLPPPLCAVLGCHPPMTRPPLSAVLPSPRMTIPPSRYTRTGASSGHTPPLTSTHAPPRAIARGSVLSGAAGVVPLLVSEPPAQST